MTVITINEFIMNNTKRTVRNCQRLPQRLDLFLGCWQAPEISGSDSGNQAVYSRDGGFCSNRNKNKTGIRLYALFVH